MSHRSLPRLLFNILIPITILSLLTSPSLRSHLSTRIIRFQQIPSVFNLGFLNMAAASKAPVYFFSHGGPNVQYETKHPAFKVLQDIGKEITQNVKPKAVVVISAHWQSDGSYIAVNDHEHTDLIYDFYGFPKHFYEAKYPNVGSPAIAGEIRSILADAGIKSEGVKRGLDHGVFSGFSVAFDPEKNPLNVPLVQVSLFGNQSPAEHYALGRALSKLRSQNIVIIGAGMSVHNLRDLARAGMHGLPLPYVKPFDDLLKAAVEANPSERESKMEEIAHNPMARQAHPHFDHLLPVYVAAGAAGDDLGKQTWTLQEASMAWAQYRFGDLPV